LLDSVRSLARDIFEAHSLGDTEDEIAENFRREVDAKFEDTTTYLQKYNYQKYPGKQAVEAADAALREIKQIRDTKDLFEKLHDKQADLRATFDALGPVASFFDHQVQFFDRGIK